MGTFLEKTVQRHIRVSMATTASPVASISSSYPYTTFPVDIVAKYRDHPPSFTLLLHDHSFTLQYPSGIAKFLYTSPMIAIFTAIKEQRIPADLIDIFEDAQIMFYESCLIVELQDFRTRSHAQSRIVRVALRPTTESIRADLSLANERLGNHALTETQILQVEEQMLVTTQPVCLDPSPAVLKVAVLYNRLQDGGKWEVEEENRRNAWLNRRERWQVPYSPSTTHESMNEPTFLLVKFPKDASPGTPITTFRGIKFALPNPAAFQPTFARLGFIHDWRARRRRKDSEPILTLSTKVSKIDGGMVKSSKKKQQLLTIPTEIRLEDGRILQYTVRFERGPSEPPPGK